MLRRDERRLQTPLKGLRFVTGGGAFVVIRTVDRSRDKKCVLQAKHNQQTRMCSIWAQSAHRSLPRKARGTVQMELLEKKDKKNVSTASRRSAVNGNQSSHRESGANLLMEIFAMLSTSVLCPMGSVRGL